MQEGVRVRVDLLAVLGRPLQPGARVLDFGCGEGRQVAALADAGFDAYGCDIVLDDPTDRLRRIEEPYRLPFDDRSFDFVLSEQVIEHVQDLDAAFREIRRVLRPGGTSLNVYPPRWIPIEPHIFVPLATVIQSKAWCRAWAMTGIRNQFQHGLSAAETAERNHRYLAEHTNYPSRRRMRELAARHFDWVRYAEREHLRARNGRLPPALARVYSGLRTRVLALG